MKSLKNTIITKDLQNDVKQTEKCRNTIFYRKNKTIQIHRLIN